MLNLLLSANQVGNLAVPLRAEAANDNDVLRTFEGSMLLAMRNDPRGVSRTDARQLHQLFRRSDVDVDTLVGFLKRRERFDGSG